MGEAWLHVVFGTGQAGSALAARLGRARCRGPGGVPAPASHAGCGDRLAGRDAADP
jgi:hypothetical protein